MKFGIITHYDVHNHGAILQLNALKEFLSGKGIEAQALQFDKNYDLTESQIQHIPQVDRHLYTVFME